MARTLLIGDVHATAPELKDCAALFNLIVRTITEKKIACVVFMGDLFHNHRTIDLYVQDFYYKQFQIISEMVETYALVGNHDQAGAGDESIHALRVFENLINIIDEPIARAQWCAIPFMGDRHAFEAAAKTLYYEGNQSKPLLCHQTFDGSKYENGFPAKDGVDPAAIPFKQIIAGHIHCFDQSTEILTDGGWKSRDQLRRGDSVVGMNLDTGLLEYTVIQSFVDRDVDEPLFRFKSKSLDLLVTSGHKMVGRRARYEEAPWMLWDASAMDGYLTEIPVAGQLVREPLPYTDDEIRLMVWMAADGNIEEGGSVRWHLKKQRKIIRLSRLLTRMGVPYKVFQQKRGTTKISLGVKTCVDHIRDLLLSDTGNKRLPSILSKCNKHQANVVIYEYGHTDGTFSTKYAIQISTSESEEADLIQEICVLNDMTCSILPKKGRTQHKIIKVRTNSNTTELFRGYNRTTEHYVGGVWCVTVPTSTIMVRRNGKVSISGNCPQDVAQVQYLGAPRWRTVSDANIDRHLWVLDGTQVVERIPTGPVCRRVWHFEDRPTRRLSPDLSEYGYKDGDSMTVAIYGSLDECRVRADIFRAAGAKVQTFPDRQRKIQIKESDGIPVAFGKFAKSFKPANGTPARQLKSMVVERLF